MADKAINVGDIVTAEGYCAHIHTLVGNCLELNKPDSALSLLYALVKICTQFPDLKKFEALSRSRLAKIFFHMKKFDVAIAEIRTNYEIMCHLDDGNMI
jgi:hypothetical protein